MRAELLWPEDLGSYFGMRDTALGSYDDATQQYYFEWTDMDGDCEEEVEDTVPARDPAPEVAETFRRMSVSPPVANPPAPLARSPPLRVLPLAPRPRSCVRLWRGCARRPLPCSRTGSRSGTRRARARESGWWRRRGRQRLRWHEGCHGMTVRSRTGVSPAANVR